jgi:hypothetical protein
MYQRLFVILYIDPDETEPVSETLFLKSTLTRLIAREDFIAFIRCDSLKSYIFF